MTRGRSPPRSRPRRSDAPSEPGPDMKRPRRRTVIWTTLVLLLALFPYTWGPALAGAAARRRLDLDVPGSSSCTVDRVSLFRLKARDIRLGALPGQPRLARLDVRYTPWGLLRGRGVRLSADGAEAELRDLLPPEVRERLRSTRATARLQFGWNRSRGYGGTLEGEILGGALRGRLSARTWRSPALALSYEPALRDLPLPALRAEASASLSDGTNGLAVAATAGARLEGSPWAVSAEATAEGGAFAAKARTPDIAFSQDDPLLAPLLRAFAPANLGLRFSGSVTGSVDVVRPAGGPEPRWLSAVRVNGLDAEIVPAGEDPVPIVLRGGRLTTLRIGGIGAHYDIQPFGIRFASLSRDRLLLEDGDFWFRASARDILLTEGSTRFAGGFVRVYALHFYFESRSTAFAIVLDDLDAGRVLALFPSVDGSVSGRLHGKIPVRVRNGARVLLQDAYLYSSQSGGNLQLRDPAPLVSQMGLDGDTGDRLSRALRDLDFTTLQIHHARKPAEDGDAAPAGARPDDDETESALTFRIVGRGNDREQTPVDISATFHGQFQKLINTALRTAGLRERAPAGR